MQDKIIWLTGASSGIGEGLAYALNKQGAKLILSSRKESELEKVKQKSLDPSKIKILPLDLGDHESLKAKADQAKQCWGDIDILINNGGISQRSLVKDTGIEVDRKLMDVNYFGTIALTKAVLPDMLEKKSGHLVVVTSLTGKFGTPLRSSYAASKHALHGFFDSLRAELHQDNIKVSIICPGFVNTNISINALTGDGSALGEMNTATEKGLSVEFCAEEMIKAIRDQKEEVIVAGKEKFGVYLKRFTPSLFSKVIRRAKVT